MVDKRTVIQSGQRRGLDKKPRRKFSPRFRYRFVFLNFLGPGDCTICPKKIPRTAYNDKMLERLGILGRSRLVSGREAIWYLGEASQRAPGSFEFRVHEKSTKSTKGPRVIGNAYLYAALWMLSFALRYGELDTILFMYERTEYMLKA